jgi:hypothetical protein
VNSQQFLILNAVILLILIIWFLLGRRSSAIKPTQLRMKQGNAPSGKYSPAASTDIQPVVTSSTQPAASASAASSVASASKKSRYSDPKFQKFLDEENPAQKPAKELNVLFNYNGHTWDAYEVLGVPAGANIVEVTRVYQELVKKSAPESQEFFETAFKAILSKK